MQLHDAISLLRQTCALQHVALKTEKSYTHWLFRYASFLKTQKARLLTQTEQKFEAFLTHLALTGVSASTQNQAFSAVLFFYRHVLKQQLANIDALRARRPTSLRYCPERSETLKLLAHVADVYRYPARSLSTSSMPAACESVNPSTSVSKTSTSKLAAFTSTKPKAIKDV